MLFWLDKGVDGFRIDAASHLIEDQLLRDEPISKKHTTQMVKQYNLSIELHYSYSFTFSMKILH